MTINAIFCVKCNEVIHSKSRHDFVWCKGKHIFVDGGNDYWRMGGNIDEKGSYYRITLVDIFTSNWCDFCETKHDNPEQCPDYVKEKIK